jgi:hypothetical protein
VPSLWYAVCLVIDVDGYYCAEHEAPNVRVELTFCFGKPTCVSCYQETGMDIAYDSAVGENDEDLSPQHVNLQPLARLFWFWCQCYTSFACSDCYHDARMEGTPLCQSCNGQQLEIPPPEYPYFAPEETDNTYEEMDKAPEETHNTPECEVIPIFCEDTNVLHSSDEMRRISINSVHWYGLLEELGIILENGLGHLISYLLYQDTTEAAELFEILDDMLGRDMALLHSLNGKPLSEKMEAVMWEITPTSLKNDLLVGISLEVSFHRLC